AAAARAPAPAALARASRRGLEDVLGGLGDGLLDGLGLGPALALLRLLHRLPALRPAHRGAQAEDPPHAGHGRGAEQPAALEEPLVFAVVLLERVVGQHDRAGAIGDLEQEAVAPADGTGGRRDHLPRRPGALELLPLALLDAIREGG